MEIEIVPFPLPDDEAERLACLASYDLQGSARETEYDQIVELGAQLFKVPVCLISIVDEDHQWLKARYGFNVERTPRDVSFCTHALLSDEAFVVLDARLDPRFADNPLVAGHPGIRFYAGVPIVTSDGVRLGAFCVMDTQPRIEFGKVEERLLEKLAGMVSTRIQTRRERIPDSAVTSFAEVTSLALVTADVNGRVTSWNKSAEAILGYGRSEMLGLPFDTIVPERFKGAHAAKFAKIISGESASVPPRTVEVSALHKNGNEIAIELSLAFWRGPTGMMFGAQMQDISERRAREASLQHLADHDDLTGLLKRTTFKDRVGARLDQHLSAIILSLDLDSFKEINDTLGHAVGDALLQMVALRLTGCVDESGVLARLGGDEFAILLPAGTDLLGAQGAAQCLLKSFSDSFEIADHHLHVGLSIGVAIAPDHAADVDDLLACADLALFAAKKMGGHNYRLFDAAMRNQMEARRAFNDELRVAFVERQWELHYQMQNRLSDGALIGLEGLLRWQHPQWGLLKPSVFMPFLETHLVANDVGNRVIHEACRQLAEWRKAGLYVPQVSVNLFSAQVRSGGLARVVRTALEQNGLKPEDLELEITETIALRHDDEALMPLFELYDAGVGIAFDDFGTGYASLTTIKRFPLTRLKIDRSFVEDIGTESHSTAIVSGILAIGTILGVDVIAEGIETEDQRSKMMALGCKQAQGYLYGQPASGPDIALYLGQSDVSALGSKLRA